MAKSPESIREASAGRILGTRPARTLRWPIQNKGVDLSEVYPMDPSLIGKAFGVSQAFEEMLGKDIS